MCKRRRDGRNAKTTQREDETREGREGRLFVFGTHCAALLGSQQSSGRPGHGKTGFSPEVWTYYKYRIMRGQKRPSCWPKDSSATCLTRGQTTTRNTRRGRAGMVEACLAWPEYAALPIGQQASVAGHRQRKLSLVSPVRARRVIPCGPPSCSLRARQTKRLGAAIGWQRWHQPVSPTFSRLTLPECRCSRLSFRRDWAVAWPPPRATAGCPRHSSEQGECARGGLPDGPRKLLPRALEAASADDPVRAAGGCAELAEASSE